jgi:hypothetical protein
LGDHAFQRLVKVQRGTAQAGGFFHQMHREALVRMANAAVMPATPPPTTSAALLTGTLSSVKGWLRATRATAMRTRSAALSVAFWGSPEWTQEHWSRMLAISTR